MNDGPLVSIVIATYNQKELVSETLQSILAQTYNNIEIIISDDGSVDGTQDVLNRFADENPTAHVYFQKKNLGITRNYNFLTEKATGEYVSVFSGDDVMSREKIALQVEVLESNSLASFCHHAVFDLDAETKNIRGIISHQYPGGITTIHDVLRNFGVPGSMSVMYRRKLARKPVFDPAIGTASDWLQLIHLVMAGPGMYIDIPLCYYRKDAGYNSKDVSKYESDFVKTIDLARSVYATEGDEIDKSCDYALARYSLGAGYRSLMRGEKKRARKFFSVRMPGAKLIVYCFVLVILSYMPLNRRILIGGRRLFKMAQRS